MLMGIWTPAFSLSGEGIDRKHSALKPAAAPTPNTLIPFKCLLLSQGTGLGQRRS